MIRERMADKIFCNIFFVNTKKTAKGSALNNRLDVIRMQDTLNLPSQLVVLANFFPCMQTI